MTLHESGRANLSNVLFDRNTTRNTKWDVNAAALDLEQPAVAVVTNAVFRGNRTGSAAVANRITSGSPSGSPTSGSLTFNGCLSFSGNYPYNTSGTGTIIDNSSGECSGTLGNGGQVLPDPVAASCGLPTGGYLDHSATFTLRGNCTQSGALVVSEGVSITIEGHGHTIVGHNPASQAIIVAGNSSLTLRNINFREAAIYNIGTLNASNIAFSGITYLAFADFGRATLESLRFIGNGSSGSFAGALASLNNYASDQMTIIRDAIFRNNEAHANRANACGHRHHHSEWLCHP